MTTGSTTYDHSTITSGIRAGTWGNRTWSGLDSPKRVKLAPARVIIVTRGSKKYRIRLPAEYGPKRSRSAEHPYNTYGASIEDRVLMVPVGGLVSNPTLAPNSARQFGQQVAQEAAMLASVHAITSAEQFKLIGKLKDAIQGSDFNMSVFLGEGHQTLELIADSAMRIARAGNLLKKGNVLGAAHRLLDGTGRKVRRHRGTAATGSISSASWLELQYGWLPLLGDCKSAAEALAHQLSVPARMTYRASVRREQSGKRVLSGFMPYFKAETNWTKETRRSIIARITEPPSSMVQLGLLDPEIVAWELLPFSFVVDWFIPIGSYLEARAYASHLTGLFITTDKTVYKDFPSTFSGPSAGFITGFREVRNSQYRMDRTISTSLDVPFPEFKPLAKAASLLHCANALALVTQVFLGRSKTPKGSPSSPASSQSRQWEAAGGRMTQVLF